jgi:integrase
MSGPGLVSGSVLESAAAARLAAAAVERDWGLGAFVRLALVAGARRGELLEVRWPDLLHSDDDSGCGTLVVACRSGGKATRARRRVALDPGTMDLLDAWHEERRAENEDDGYVFSSGVSGSPPWDPVRVTRQVAALAAQADVSASIVALRRYSMVRLAALGVAPR